MRLCGTGHLKAEDRLISAPFLQLPAAHSVRVVWFTSFEGHSHWVEWGNETKQRAVAHSRRLSRIREDLFHPDGSIKGCAPVAVWRHEAEVAGLKAGHRLPYRIASQKLDGEILYSSTYSLAPAPPPGQAMRILLTSDHQRKPMVPANLQKATETIGHFDAVFFAGDLVELADGYPDWFTHPCGFFPSLQGKAEGPVHGRVYKGAEIIQHTPVFPAIGNHDVMGRYSLEKSLHFQFHDPYPREQAALLSSGQNEDKLKDLSFNTDTYEEIFTLPVQSQGHSTYYATTVGDVRLVVLYATRIWRSPEEKRSQKGKYQEAKDALAHPDQWGHGDFIFEPLEKGSKQYEWLIEELQSAPFQQAKLRMVMLHNPLHTLGENAVPPFSNPIQTIRRDEKGCIQAIEYAYPKEQDILIRDIEPLLEQYEVDLVLCGHSHVWNRFQSKEGMHFLETSNVGNSYGAYTSANNHFREMALERDLTNYVAMDDPNGLEPIVPSIAPLKDERDQPLPYIASNELTVFSVLDTGRKVIDSYYFDTKHPEKGVVKFDSFCPYRRLSTDEMAEKYRIKMSQGHLAMEKL
ncbi:metallophosphoesterase family protein [Candidatus Protochlamydia phocaeensis]|uniref:metallophosphoesterase family protein n=1 Tax=Candidatus Protochlamydia phocaeensis TaxID=1414722 RepID=UPI0009ACB941|nr:metallophosphoesterase [Candidatus Protochlamydia phocaeensis]